MFSAARFEAIGGLVRINRSNSRIKGELQAEFSVWVPDNSGVDGDKRVYEDLCCCPFANSRSAQWRATELWLGKPERSCVAPLRLLVWRRCRRLCPNNSAGPLRLFTDRNRAGFWRRSCASSEIWISPKRPCMRHSPPLWSPGLRLLFRTGRAPG